MSARNKTLAVAAAVLETGFCWLILKQDEPSREASAIALLLGTFVVYLISVFLILNKTQSDGVVASSWPVRGILLAAMVFRLTVWWLEPRFTDDLYRYRWEARLQLAGGNPYRVSPQDPAVQFLRDETFFQIPGRDARAVYGPLTLLVYRETFRWIERFATRPEQQVFWLKLPSAIFDLGLLGALWALVRAGGWDGQRILIYAWAPLPIFEFWGNGHNDPLALCPLVLAWWAAVSGRWLICFFLLGLSAAAKIWPVVLAPLLVWPSRWRQSLLLPATVVLLLAPFGDGLLSNGRLLLGFLGGWRNNDSVFGFLLWLTGDPRWATSAACLLVVAAIVYARVKRLPLTQGGLVVVSTLLFVSANCHPWYLTWLIPLLVFHPSLALLTWTGLIPLAYEVLPAWRLLGEWRGLTAGRWLIYAPVFTLLAYEGVVNMFQKKSIR